MEKENKENRDNKENKSKNNKFLNFIKELIPYIIIVVVVIFVKNYIIAPVEVTGDSMYSTLHDGDIMLLNRLDYKRNGVERFDIVVIKNNNTHIIKRIIGLPGDKIEVKDNELYINDELVKEPYIDKNTITNDFTLKDLFNAETVPDNYYFVLGDNREVSMDSRMIGFVSKDKIEGIATFTIFPINRFGSKGI